MKNLAFVIVACGLIVGCGTQPATKTVSSPALTLQGKVHGGQQPVSLATIQLYAVNTTTLAGASTALISSTVRTASDGSFTISSAYTCPTITSTPVYLVAQAGNPGLTAGTNNASLILVSALGPCSGLSSSTYVTVNEVSTVAMAWALGTAMTDYTHVGATSLTAITSAFTLASQLSNIATGTAPGGALPTGSYAPTMKINTMGNILASCVNSDGTGSTGNTTACGQLFTATTYSGTRPTDTTGAAIQIAANPANGVSTLFGLKSSSPPFQPSLSNAPSDWTMTVASVTWPAPSGISVGVSIGATQLNATATIPGSFVYSPVSGTTPSAGTTSLGATFTPTDNTDYPTISASNSLAVNNQNYTFGNVAMVGGGYVDGIIVHPTQANVRYARTDVGGAYQWNQATGKWVSLTDFIGDNNRGGCESIALDPTNYLNVYLAMGEYSESYGENGLFLISTNGGTSFTQVAAPFKMGSNDPGRTGGERMAVDPNLPTKLYYGSYRDGLWVSTNSGTSWSKVSTFPVYSTTTGAAGTGGVPPNSEDYTGFAGAGVIFVQFVAASGTSGNATPVIYVGVSDTGTSGTGYSSLYVSANGGTSWTAVSGQPTGAYPIRSSLANSSAGANTILYIAYSSGAAWSGSTTITNGIGPASVSGGSLYKYALPTTPGATGGTWTSITPTTPARANGSQGGFASIVADPNNLGVVMATTLDDYYPGDDIYRSLNYGSTWESVLRITHATNPATTPGATYSTTNAPWTTFGGTITNAGTWPTSLAIDPANSNHVLYGTGQTLWDSTNIQNADSAGTGTFNVGALGIEETVVQALASPPSGPILYSGVDDIGGFVHTSLTTSPSTGLILNDSINPIQSIDVAWSLPSTVALIGYSGGSSGAYSTNSGTSWTKFSASPSGTTSGDGQIAVSANGATFVWAPSDAPVAYSTNNGSTWTASSNSLNQSGVVADRVNSNKFYILSGSSFQISTNGGQTFTTLSGTGLPSSSTNGQLSASFAAEGDLWIAYASHGVYHSTNSGSTWTSVTGSPSNNIAISFGAAAPGGSYPTIYVLTSSSNVNGFYRSVNAGQTWTHINTTTTNQYAYVQLIVGDPKTFGRFFVSTGGRGVVYGDSAY